MEGLLTSYGSSHVLGCHIMSPTTSCQRSNTPRDAHLSPLVLGVSMSKLTGTDPLEVMILPRSDYLLVARMSSRSKVPYDVGRGFRDCDMRHGHMLLYPALERSWWMERPEQTVILSIPAQLLKRAWGQDREEPWPDNGGNVFFQARFTGYTDIGDPGKRVGSAGSDKQRLHRVHPIST
jgi:hypothetical protein